MSDFAIPNIEEVSGLAGPCEGSEELKNGYWCLEFKTIDKVSK